MNVHIAYYYMICICYLGMSMVYAGDHYVRRYIYRRVGVDTRRETTPILFAVQ
jgi:hypothetical protein